MGLTPGAELLQFATKTITFTGAANLGLAASNITIFAVTGQILIVRLVPYCVTSLEEAAASATIRLGHPSATNWLIADTAAIAIDAGYFWVDASPDPDIIALPAALKDIVTGGNIIARPLTQNITAGVIRFDLYWMPLSSGATVV